MLRIRLRRPGKSVKGIRHYKIVVIDSKSARDARFVDELGHYDPSRKLLKINITRYEDWFKKGAKPTETVASLFKKYKKQGK
jgi:small subunit ribosomal protein S16